MINCCWRDVADFVVTGHLNLNAGNVNDEDEKEN